MTEGDGEVPALAQLAPSRAERAASAVLPGTAVVWTAAEIMHWAGQPGGGPVALIAAALAGIAYGAAARSRRKGLRDHALHLLAGIGVTGGWLALAAAEGPLHGWPYAPLTWTWLLASLGAWRWAHGHPAVVSSRERRADRAAWLYTRREWHLGGSHLLGREETLLGEAFDVDIKETGKLASALARSDLPERIAAARGLPRSRVHVSEGHLAGRIRISIRNRDPWAKPLEHPVTAASHEIALAERPSITDPIPVGQDPETGKLLTLLLCGPGGGRNINIVATIEGGKTTLLNCISERVTACRDAIQFRVHVSIKGDSERYLWGPSCHLTALGPQEVNRALKVLKVIAGIIQWRSRQPKVTANWVPSPGNPHIVLIMDEIDALAEVPALRKMLGHISSKGREFGVTTVRAGQRGTAQWTGGGNVKAVDGMWCLGALNSSTEAMHVAGELGLRLPEVSSYGEGNPGVWIFAERGGKWQGGRGWNLCEPADVARIAEERAHSQPDLPEACKAFLGEEYEQLLGTDVYARWAHGRTVTPPPEVPSQEGAYQADSPVIVAADPIEHLDWTMQMDEDTTARLRALDEKNAATRAYLEETEAMDKGPDVPEEKLRESSEERWRQVGEQAQMTAEHRETLTSLLRDGTTISDAAAALGVTAWIARTYLQKLRNEGTARIDGKGRGARWRIATGSSDSQ